MKTWVTEYTKKKQDGCDAKYSAFVYGNTIEEAQAQADLLGVGRVVGSEPSKYDFDTLEEIPIEDGN